jgi:hypothetical protein
MLASRRSPIRSAIAMTPRPMPRSPDAVKVVVARSVAVSCTREISFTAGCPCCLYETWRCALGFARCSQCQRMYLCTLER